MYTPGIHKDCRNVLSFLFYFCLNNFFFKIILWSFSFFSSSQKGLILWMKNLCWFLLRGGLFLLLSELIIVDKILMFRPESKCTLIGGMWTMRFPYCALQVLNWYGVRQCTTSISVYDSFHSVNQFQFFYQIICYRYMSSSRYMLYISIVIFVFCISSSAQTISVCVYVCMSLNFWR